jgi:hypothetical protein
MRAHECHHCKQWIEADEPHDCWTTTEAALTSGLSEDLRDAWDRIRETAVEFGPQRIYASGTAIMFSRAVCYFFVRPKKSFLEVCVFLGRTVRAPQIRRVHQTSKTKLTHIIHVRHRDEVEAPITDWLREAYGLPDVLSPRAERPATQTKRKTSHKASKSSKTARKTRTLRNPTRR